MPRRCCRPRISRRISPRSCASRLESGSSMRHTGVSATMARPSATRCCWPPESCEGLRSRSFSRPSSSATRSRRAARSATLRTRSPKTMFSATVRWGKSAYDWNTIEMPRAAGGNLVTSRPPMRMAPALGVSRPAMRRSVVDLPQPEGPSSTTKEPGSAANVMPSRARDSAQCLAMPSSSMEDTGQFCPRGGPGHFLPKMARH